VGQKLEALHPQARTLICPATVTSLIASRWIVVEIDDLSAPSDEKVRFWCSGDALNILPVGYCEKHGLKLTPPIGNYGMEKGGIWQSLAKEIGYFVYVESPKPTLLID
jgi:hypothetical protein